jgi:hypothetical protein
MSIWNNFRQWHEGQVYGFQKACQLDDYHMYWLAFVEGVVLTLLFLWLI